MAKKPMGVRSIEDFDIFNSEDNAWRQKAACTGIATSTFFPTILCKIGLSFLTLVLILLLTDLTVSTFFLFFFFVLFIIIF